MTTYRIGQVATMAGVSIRTLRHYDEIGLLKPSARSDASYRIYTRTDLERLQQALFYRELDIPLVEITAILDDPDFDQTTALLQHRQRLQARASRINTLLQTIDRTLTGLKEDTMPLTDEQLYEGFTKEEMEQDKREVAERYDPALVAESQKRLRELTPQQWQAVKVEGNEITKSLAALMGSDPASEAVQGAIAHHRQWLEHFYPPTKDVYIGLADGYASDPRFRANYDKYADGLADFIRDAMHVYAEREM